MFETEVDDTPRPCNHELRWYHRLAAWAHDRIEALPFLDRERLHTGLARWVCESYERVRFDFPCWACEADRYREYGATTKTDADVIARMRTGIMARLPEMPCPHTEGGDCVCNPDECSHDDCDPLAYDG